MTSGCSRFGCKSLMSQLNYFSISTYKWTEWKTLVSACRGSWQWRVCWDHCQVYWSSPDQPTLSTPAGQCSDLKIFFLLFYLIYTEVTEILHCPTSSPSEQSSDWCWCPWGQSGHTRPMEDSDKGKCTLVLRSYDLLEQRWGVENSKAVGKCLQNTQSWRCRKIQHRAAQMLTILIFL